jgi:hypothetical protein
MRASKRSKRLSALALVAAMSAASTAQADATTDQARVYFDAGAQAYSAGRYPVAIEAFTAAYHLVPKPAILFSLAQAERKEFWIDKRADGIGRAIQHYREYLTEVPEGGRRDDAVTALAELESAAARLATAAPEGAVAAPVATKLLLSSRATGATAVVDGAAPADLPRLLELAPGKHHVVIAADGYYPDERDVVALGGVTTPYELNLREKPGLLTVDADAGARVYVDGRRVADLPTSHPVEVAAGPHVVEVSRNGRQLFSTHVTAERGKETRITAPLVVSRQRTISEVVLAVGGVGALASVAFLAVAVAEQGSAEDILNAKASHNISSAQLSSYNDDLSLRDGWRTAAIATGSAGLTVLAAGAALFFFDHPAPLAKQESPEGPSPLPVVPTGCGCAVEVSLVPMASPGFGGAALLGRF